MSCCRRIQGRARLQRVATVTVKTNANTGSSGIRVQNADSLTFTLSTGEQNSNPETCSFSADFARDVRNESENGAHGGIGMDCPVRPQRNRRQFPESPTPLLASVRGHFTRWELRVGDVAMPASEQVAQLLVLKAGDTETDSGPGGLTESRRCVRDLRPSRQRSGHRILSGPCPDRRQRTFCRKGHRG